MKAIEIIENRISELEQACETLKRTIQKEIGLSDEEIESLISAAEVISKEMQENAR